MVQRKISNTSEIDAKLKGLREKIKKIKNDKKRKQINKGIRKINSLLMFGELESTIV